MTSRQVKATDLREGDEVVDVGVMEADAEPLGSTHVRLYIGECAYDKPANMQVTVAGLNTADPQPRETNTRIAHESIVTVKYALHAVAADATLTDAEKDIAAMLAQDAEILVSRVHALRYRLPLREETTP